MLDCGFASTITVALSRVDGTAHVVSVEIPEQALSLTDLLAYHCDWCDNEQYHECCFSELTSLERKWRKRQCIRCPWRRCYEERLQPAV